MGRCLLVANKSLGGEAIDQTVRDCISRGVREFYVAVPRAKVKDQPDIWILEGMSPDRSQSGQEGAAGDETAAVDEARRQARQRLDQLIEKIQTAGGEADGAVGVDDPVEAAREALEHHGDFDEIIVSTLPTGIGRWVKMDVPHRIARLTDVPVTTVEAEAESA